ncbi:MAG TPA: response regulator [Chthoniobacteraceae bacterium]|jgi:signal transduction histidine kinase|nr:response regulator [Chthoniobacteraceae bacterium]
MSQSSPTTEEAALILIAEDSPTQSLRLRYFLTKHGFRVVTAGDGAEALFALESCSPALVITDIQMPVMDGYALCRQLKHDPTWRELPVILLTSLSSPHDIIEGLACGADNFVVKPYEEEFLLRRIDSVLANRNLPQPSGDGVGITVEFAGSRYLIDATRRQILSLLLSTYETAVETNKDLVRTHERLKAAQAELIDAEKLQTVGRLAAGVAHEVRNPLAIMEMGMTILSTMLPAEEGAAVLAEMREALRRADFVITSLMEMSTPGEVGMREADLHALIECVLERVLDGGGQRRIVTVRQFAPEMPAVRMDPERLEQVFINLVTNACQAMPEGGTLTVRTELRLASAQESVFCAGDRSGHRWREGDRLVVVEIGDTGSGIAPEHLDKIFDPFFSTKPTGKGMGLGLTVARKLVDLHGGSLAVTQKPGGGTLVSVVLKLE